MIAVRDLVVRAGTFSMRGISFEVPRGEYAVVMGRTGSGKTTLLEAVCGLRSVEEGSVILSGKNVTSARPSERGVGYVPQDRALFQTMTVADNLAFALHIRKWDPGEIGKRVAELAGWLGIGALLGRRPAGLSGGEAQRVALGRALAARPEILCLDEPLGALDEETREEMCGVLSSVRRHTEATVLHVTHSLSEARRLADKVILLKDGAARVQSPVDLA